MYECPLHLFGFVSDSVREVGLAGQAIPTLQVGRQELGEVPWYVHGSGLGAVSRHKPQPAGAGPGMGSHGRGRDIDPKKTANLLET